MHKTDPRVQQGGRSLLKTPARSGEKCPVLPISKIMDRPYYKDLTNYILETTGFMCPVLPSQGLYVADIWVRTSECVGGGLGGGVG